MRDGARWLQTALSLAPARSMKRGRALTRLGDLLQRIGRNDESEAPLREALAIGEETGDEAGLARALTDLAYLEADRQSDDALPLARAAHEHASNTGDQNLIDVTRMPLSNALIDQGHMDEAEALILESLEFRTSIGDAINSAYMLINLATLAYRRQDWDRARSGYRQGNDALRAAGHPAYWIAEYRIGLLSYLAEHDPSTALSLLVGALDFAASAESEDGLTSCAQAIALVAAGVDVVAAADLVDAADALRADLGLKVNPADEAILEPLRTSLHSHAGTEPSQTATKVRITLEDAVARARDLAARARGL
jgi:tetratricopeptide (TPR) repeat protein